MAKIAKPLTVAEEDFKRELATLINESGLPITTVGYILWSVTTEVNTMIAKQCEADRAAYEKALKEEEDGTTDN